MNPYRPSQVEPEHDDPRPENPAWLLVAVTCLGLTLVYYLLVAAAFSN
ncbi:MAG: hypothetical protein AAGA03_08445 [Planctomycetota bacterium]